MQGDCILQSPFYNIRRFSFFCIIRPEDTLQYRFDMEKRIVSDVKIHCRVIRKNHLHNKTRTCVYCRENQQDIDKGKRTKKKRKKVKKVKKVIDKPYKYEYNDICAVRRQVHIRSRIQNHGEILKRLKRRPC